MRALVALLLLCTPLAAQEPVKVTKLPGPNEAITLALADSNTLPRDSCCYTRFIWITSGDHDGYKAVSDAVNRISRSARIYKPQLLGRDKLMVARVELQRYALNDADLREWLSLWEEFQFDPEFSFFITKGMLRLAIENDIAIKGEGTVKRWRTILGKKRLVKSREAFDVTIDVDNVELIRTPDPGIDPLLLASISELTGSQAPVVTDTYFLARVLATIQEKGLYREIFGGLYYQFAGIKKGFRKGTDEDNFLESLGVGNVDAGITAAKVFAKIPSSQKVGVEVSKLHGRPRVVEFLHTLAPEFGQAAGIAAFTFDGTDEDIDVDVHPLENLADFKPRAKECIYERLNGMHGYALFDDKGALQDEVPPNIANDLTITHARTRRLQSAVSCIACHEGQGPDGWQVIVNDVAKLANIGILPLGNYRRMDRATRDRLIAQYTGNPERALQRGRDDFSLAVFRATGPWKQSKTQTNVVKLSADRLVGTWRAYFYDAVDARQALLESRIDCDPKDAQALLVSLMKATAPPITPLDHLGELVVQEDRRIGHLVAGTPLTRTDWALVAPVFKERARRAMVQMFKEKK